MLQGTPGSAEAVEVRLDLHIWPPQEAGAMEGWIDVTSAHPFQQKLRDNAAARTALQRRQLKSASAANMAKEEVAPLSRPWLSSSGADLAAKAMLLSQLWPPHGPTGTATVQPRQLRPCAGGGRRSALLLSVRLRQLLRKQVPATDAEQSAQMRLTCLTLKG